MGPAAVAAPAWVGYMSLAATAAASIGSAYMQSQAASANSKVARMNAENARHRKRQLLDEGRAEESRLKRKVGLFRSRQVVFAAGQGRITGRGSALKHETDTATAGKADVIRLRNRVANMGWGYDVQAAGFETEAQMARMMGTVMPALTLLGGAAEGAGIYNEVWGGGNKKTPSPLATTRASATEAGRVAAKLG